MIPPIGLKTVISEKICAFLLIVFAVSVSVLFFMCGCSSSEKKALPQQHSIEPDSAAQKDSVKPVTQNQHCPDDTIEKNISIISPKGSPILEVALRNKKFNAQKWLASDHMFLNRLTPNRISDYDNIIKKMARRYGFDWRLIAAQIYTESNFKTDACSPVGAIGLMQIMPKTAQFLGFSPQSVINPEINIAVGCRYDQRMYSLWGRQTTDYNRLAFALASYNAGRARVLKKYSTEDSLTSWENVYSSLPEETQSYVHKIYLKYHFYKRYILP